MPGGDMQVGQKYNMGQMLIDMGFNIPEKEKQKMEGIIKQQPELEKLYKSFSKGGAASIATASTLIGSAVMLVTSGAGFKAVLGAFWDLIGLVSDLIFVALFPIIKPLLDAFVQIGKKLIEKAHGPGGIFGAIFDSELWVEVGIIFLTGILQAGTKLFELGAQIANSVLIAMNSAPGSGLGPLAENLGQAFLEFLEAKVEFVVAWAEVFLNALLRMSDALQAIWQLAAQTMLQVLEGARQVWETIAGYIADGFVKYVQGKFSGIGGMLGGPMTGSGAGMQGMGNPWSAAYGWAQSQGWTP